MKSTNIPSFINLDRAITFDVLESLIKSNCVNEVFTLASLNRFKSDVRNNLKKGNLDYFQREQLKFETQDQLEDLDKITILNPDLSKSEVYLKLNLTNILEKSGDYKGMPDGQIGEIRTWAKGQYIKIDQGYWAPFNPMLHLPSKEVHNQTDDELLDLTKNEIQNLLIKIWKDRKVASESHNIELSTDLTTQFLRLQEILKRKKRGEKSVFSLRRKLPEELSHLGVEKVKEIVEQHKAHIDKPELHPNEVLRHKYLAETYTEHLKSLGEEGEKEDLTKVYSQRQIAIYNEGGIPIPKAEELEELKTKALRSWNRGKDKKDKVTSLTDEETASRLKKDDLITFQEITSSNKVEAEKEPEKEPISLPSTEPVSELKSTNTKVLDLFRNLVPPDKKFVSIVEEVLIMHPSSAYRIISGNVPLNLDQAKKLADYFKLNIFNF